MKLKSQLILETEREIKGLDGKIKVRRDNGSFWYGQGKYLYPAKRNKETGEFSYSYNVKEKVEKDSTENFSASNIITYSALKLNKLIDNNIDYTDLTKAKDFLRKNPTKEEIASSTKALGQGSKIKVKKDDGSFWFESYKYYYQLTYNKEKESFTYNLKTSKKEDKEVSRSEFKPEKVIVYSFNKLVKLLSNNIDPTNTVEVEKFDRDKKSKLVSRGTEYKKREITKEKEENKINPKPIKSSKEEKEEKITKKSEENKIEKKDYTYKKDYDDKEEDDIPTSLDQRNLRVLKRKDYRVENNPSYTGEENRKNAFDEVKADFNLMSNTVDNLTHLYVGKSTTAIKNLIPLFSKNGKYINFSIIKREFPKNMLDDRIEALEKMSKESKTLKRKNTPIVGKFIRKKERKDEDALAYEEGENLLGRTLNESIFKRDPYKKKEKLNKKEDKAVYGDKLSIRSETPYEAATAFRNEYDNIENHYEKKMNALISIYKKRLVGFVKEFDKAAERYTSLKLHPANIRDENVFFETFGEILNNMKLVLKRLSVSGSLIIDDYRDTLKRLYLNANRKSADEKLLDSREGEVLRKRSLLKSTNERIKEQNRTERKETRQQNKEIRSNKNEEKEAIKSKIKEIKQDEKNQDRIEKDDLKIEKDIEKGTKKYSELNAKEREQKRKLENKREKSIKGSFREALKNRLGKGIPNSAKPALKDDDDEPVNILQLAKKNIKR